ncbi:unnamed protein product [Orchesella dallaii]|uniref:Ionotropic glutamate receptor C-terminal domain-containing protein n=1 Tax=Orchesella dallaii TaxID=48710 RepID=A0ABP1R8P4_9HEXA
MSLSSNNDFHRLSSYCKLVVTSVPQVKSEFSDSFIQLVTPLKNPIAKRDEDYFIFVTKNEQRSRALLLSHVSYQLRFKLVIHFQENGHNGENLSIRSLCIYCPSSMARFVKVSSHSSNPLESIFPDFTLNFHQHKIRISAPTKYTATYEMEKVNGTYRHRRGIHALIYNTVAQKLNMSYTLHPCSKFGIIPEGSSGVFLRNGTWAGCMGDVVRNVTDMSLSVSPDDKRIHYVHFTSAIDYTPVTYTTLKPGYFYSWRTIFTAFTPGVWTLVIVSLIFTTALIHIIDYHCGFKSSQDSTSKMMRLIELAMYLFGYLVSQDVPRSPKYISSKFTFFIWLYYGLVIGAAYACSLQALIVSPDLEFAPRTFSELTNSHDYKWGAATGFRNGLGEQVFKNSDNPMMREIYHKMEGDSDEVSCTAKTAIKKYACFNWALMEQFRFQTTFADKTGNHPFQESTDTAFFVSLNFITRKREIYLSHFNSFIKLSFDSGLTKQTIARDWMGYRRRVIKEMKEGKSARIISVDSKDGPRPFGLNNVKGSFIILLSGLAFAIINFLVENMVNIKGRKLTFFLFTQ